ncbi:MAG TPA: CoA pyrophosphatase [Nitrososphaerales archaeon]|nr:CoA pyrophosphatase [Nitrososphaerales archaeon]
MDGETFAKLIKNLVLHEPPRTRLRFASVALIVRGRRLPSILLIRRAERAGDPWSGQVAFPGGKMQDGDTTARDTAVRETMEEVGIDLSRSSEFLGYGGVATTHTGTMNVIPAVFELKKSVEVRPNAEVASFRWVELDELLTPSARATYELDRGGSAVGMPAYQVGDYVVWGLTYRILSTCLDDGTQR